MEQASTYSKLVLIANGSKIGLVEAEEEIVAPDGAPGLLRTMRALRGSLNMHGKIVMKPNGDPFQVMSFHGTTVLPLLEDVGVILGRTRTPIDLLGKTVFVDGKNAFGTLLSTDKARDRGVVLVMMDEDKLEEMSVRKVFPLVSGSIVFDSSAGNCSYPAEAKQSANYLVQITEPPNENEEAGFVHVSRSFSNSAKYEDSVQKLSVHLLCIPDFLLKRRTEDTVVGQPIAVYENGAAKQGIYYRLKKRDALTAMELEPGVRALYEMYGDLYVFEVIEPPSEKNHYHMGARFLSPRVKDHVKLESGKIGLYLDPRDIKLIIYRERLSNVVQHVGVSEEDGVYAEEATIIERTLKSYFEDKVLVEFKKDITEFGGHGADGLGSPGRCKAVNIRDTYPSSEFPICAKNFLKSCHFFYVDENAPSFLQEELDKLGTNGYLKAYLDMGYKTDVENLVGIMIAGSDAFTEERIPGVVLLDKEKRIVPCRSIIAGESAVKLSDLTAKQLVRS